MKREGVRARSAATRTWINTSKTQCRGVLAGNANHTRPGECPIVYERQMLRKGSFMYLAELCCSWIVVGPSLKGDCFPSSGGRPARRRVFMRQQVQSCPCLAGSKTSRLLDNT